MPQPVNLSAHLRVESHHIIGVASAWLEKMHDRLALHVDGLRKE
jgi:hypothetical protein